MSLCQYLFSLLYWSETAFENCFQAPYAASSKTPDWYCRVNTDNLPRIVVESGWSECWHQLDQDRDPWMRAGAPKVQLVLIFRWEEISGGRVRGDLQSRCSWKCQYRTDRSKTFTPCYQNQRIIFWDSKYFNGGAAQTVTVARGQIFGTTIFPGRNRNDQWQLGFDRLRPLAGEKLRKMGLTAA